MVCMRLGKLFFSKQVAMSGKQGRKENFFKRRVKPEREKGVKMEQEKNQRVSSEMLRHRAMLTTLKMSSLLTRPVFEEWTATNVAITYTYQTCISLLTSVLFFKLKQSIISNDSPLISNKVVETFTKQDTKNRKFQREKYIQTHIHIYNGHVFLHNPIPCTHIAFSLWHKGFVSNGQSVVVCTAVFAKRYELVATWFTLVRSSQLYLLKGQRRFDGRCYFLNKLSIPYTKKLGEIHLRTCASNKTQMVDMQ